MISALATSTTTRISPLATFFMTSVISLSSFNSPLSKRRINAILVDVESLDVRKFRWRAVAGLTIAFLASGCSAEVENAKERPPNR